MDQDYEFGTNLCNYDKKITTSTFLGYRRSNGKVGTRNTIAILTSVNCSATAARLIAEHFTSDMLSAYPNVFRNDFKCMAACAVNKKTF